MIKAYLDKKFAKFSLICPKRINAKFFWRVPCCAHNELEKVVSKRLELDV
jgi:hypothetical protein